MIPLLPKTALTIGFFDGVHLGHQALLKRLREVGKHTTLLTYSNHPSTILHAKERPLLISLPQKLELLAPFVDALITIPFTLEFASTSYNDLLSQFSLSHLILGEGSAFGKNREGNEAAIRAYAKKHQFEVEYLPKLKINNEPVSSTRIRSCLAAGNTALAQQLLGHNV